MATHYRNGGLPPWATATVGVGGVGDSKAPLSPNDYKVNSGVTPPLTQNEKPSQFGVYDSNTQSNATGYGYTATTYHTADTIPQTPPPQTLSPHSQYSRYSPSPASFEPYNASANLNATPYAPPAAPPTQYSAPSSPPPGTPAPYDSPPKEPPYAEASGSAPAPSYSGGPYGANEYPKEKGWEYTSPPAEHPPKQ